MHRLKQARGGQLQHQPPAQDNPRPARQPRGHHEGLQNSSVKGKQKFLQAFNKF